MQTPLYDWHVAHSAKLVDFGGWDMPIQYTSIATEHVATRTKAGLFDISHMGRVIFEGDEAVALLDTLITNRVDSLKPGQIRYALVLNEEGTTLDDVLVYRLKDRYMLVVNASNREKLLPWFSNHAEKFACEYLDQSEDWAMIACQGPHSVPVAEKVTKHSFDDLKYYYCSEVTYDGAWCLASRTGYTGEDGVELIVPASLARQLWEELMDAGQDVGMTACGLGARDTLRLEAGMPLYGHELSEELDPLQAGLQFAVKAKSKDFIGKDALLARPQDRPVRVGLTLDERRIAREGDVIQVDDRPIGTVTSGTFSPTLEKPIAMGFVPPEHAQPGTNVQILIRNRPASAQVCSIPFYVREK